jgi:hypothetical protein
MGLPASKAAGQSETLALYKESNMSDPKTYNISCFCGAVQFTVTGEPASMGYCHCTSCRHWSASPVNAFKQHFGKHYFGQYGMIFGVLVG